MPLYNFDGVLSSEFARYRVVYNRDQDLWRILDLHHEALMGINDPDSDIPDNSPALKILPGLAVRSLLEEMGRLGMGSGVVNAGTTALTPVVSVEPVDPIELKKLAMEKISEIVEKAMPQDKREVAQTAIDRITELAEG